MSYNLRSAEAAARLGVSAETLRRWAAANQVRHIKLPSGHRRYSEEDIDALLTPVEPGVEQGDAA